MGCAAAAATGVEGWGVPAPKAAAALSHHRCTDTPHQWWSAEDVRKHALDLGVLLDDAALPAAHMLQRWRDQVAPLRACRRPGLKLLRGGRLLGLVADVAGI